MRSRNIKPGFYKNEELVKCSVWARLLAPGLWMLADREGRLEDRPNRIKMEIFPADDVNVGLLLDELHRAGHIKRYETTDKNTAKKYIQVVFFTKHQRPHNREAESEIPEYQELIHFEAQPRHGLGTTLVVPEHNLGTAQPALNPDSLIPECGMMNDERYPVKKISRLNFSGEDFEKFWKAYPAYRRREKPRAFEAWKDARRSAEASEIMAGLERYCLSSEVLSGFAPYPAKWLKQERWREEHEVEPPNGGYDPSKTDWDKLIYGDSDHGNG